MTGDTKEPSEAAMEAAKEAMRYDWHINVSATRRIAAAIDTAVQGETDRIRALVTPQLRESAEELHKAKFWVERGGSGSDFEVLKSCLKHATSDFAGAVQDVRTLLAALSPTVDTEPTGETVVGCPTMTEMFGEPLIKPTEPTGERCKKCRLANGRLTYEAIWCLCDREMNHGPPVPKDPKP